MLGFIDPYLYALCLFYLTYKFYDSILGFVGSKNRKTEKLKNGILLKEIAFLPPMIGLELFGSKTTIGYFFLYLCPSTSSSPHPPPELPRKSTPRKKHKYHFC